MTFESERGNWGVRVGSGVESASLTDVRIMGTSGNREGKGVIMGGTKMTMTNVDISKVKVGVEVQAGTLNMMGGTVTFEGGNGNWGVKVENGATANLMGVAIMGTSGGKGVWMEGTGGTMTMNMVNISEVQTGIQVTSGNLTVSGGEMTGVQTGITMSGSGTLMVNNNAKITFKGDHGVKVGESVKSASLMGVTIMGTSGGKGVLMNGREMTISGGSISNVAMGVEATAGNLTIKGHSTITFTSGAGNYGVRVGSGASADLTDVTIKGGGATGKGVWMEGKMLKMTNGEISNVDKGVYVGGAVTNASLTNVNISGVKVGVEATNGTLTVNEGTRITFTGSGQGVKVESGVTSASLTDVRIVGGGSGKGTGVIKEGEGGMTLTSVGISNVAMGVEATAGRLEIKGGSIEFTNSGMENYGVKVGSAVTSATLTSVTIEGGGSGHGNGGGYGGDGGDDDGEGDDFKCSNGGRGNSGDVGDKGWDED
ncbi:hypothetical protein BBbe_01790 [Bartonella bovis 91-4]|uniref:Right handed beta helix domain-containing protein n=1 Tax=Bartonella bovis 91-4 TaxID=1094491 RepID=N6URX0_9HYPH|nr:hypothetical protein [Bartonella bovis]ENN92908.1 hypothetical protein BBbe_01790 [Bartonella bovis 91-4]